MRNFFYKMASALLSALLLTTAIQPVAPTRAAGILYAKPGGLTYGHCASWTNACELRYALYAEAASGDEIWAMQGTYYLQDGTDRTRSFRLKNDVAVYGGFAGTELNRSDRNPDPATNATILSGDIGTLGDASDNVYHVVTADSSINSSARLDGFTIRDGNANFQFGIGTDSGGGMYIEGAPTIANVILTANNSYNGGGMNIKGAPTLSNVTLTANNAIDYGGGVYSFASFDVSATYSNVTFSNNTANSGGGMFNFGPSPVLSNVTFTNNHATSGGGGMENYMAGKPSLTNVVFNGNTASNGGGLYSYGIPTLTNVAFENNTATYGGGMYIRSGGPTLKGVTFHSNRASSYGGGIMSYSASPTLTNVTFSANTASSGGGMYNDSSSNSSVYLATLMNVTFSGNSAGSEGGGMYDYFSKPNLTNVIMWGDTAPAGSEIFNHYSPPNTIIPSVSYSVIEGSGGSGASWDASLGTDGGGNLDVDPALGPLQDNGGFTQTMAVGAGSSALDSGTNSGCPATDQRGVPRPQGAGCEIGAYEQDTGAANLVSFTRQSPSSSPTNADVLVFQASFSENVQNVNAADFTVTGTTAAITGIAGVGTGPVYSQYDITVSGGDLADLNGTVGIDLSGSQDIQDYDGHPLPNGEPATDETYLLDNIAPTITINNPDTLPATSKTITASTSEGVLEMSNTTSTTCDGTLTFISYASQTFSSESDNGMRVCYRAADGASNTSFSLSDPISGIDTTAIEVVSSGGVVGEPGSLEIVNGGRYQSHFTSILITFTSDASNPGGDSDPDDVTNPDNYQLIAPGPDGVFTTTGCGGISPDDLQISTGPVVYENNSGAGPFLATVLVNGGAPLPSSLYRLYICGTTSITDLAGNPLNSGSDESRDFTIADPANLPATGFPQGQVSLLPDQPASKAYSGLKLSLEIPALGVTMPIVGVPQSVAGWDVTWLGNNAGWLAGSAFPTWEGNTVITAHVWDAYNQPGPFAELRMLRYGDQFYIHTVDETYTYEVQESRTYWSNTAADKVFLHKDRDWVTLLTCESYNPLTGDYLFRRVVRAVLVSVNPD